MMDTVKLQALEERMAALEHRTEELTSLIANDGLVFRIEQQTEILSKLQRIVQGDEELHVNPLRTEVITLSGEIKRMAQTYDRVKWVAFGLGLTNIGAVVAWLSTAFK